MEPHETPGQTVRSGCQLTTILVIRNPNRFQSRINKLIHKEMLNKTVYGNKNIGGKSETRGRMGGTPYVSNECLKNAMQNEKLNISKTFCRFSSDYRKSYYSAKKPDKPASTIHHSMLHKISRVLMA